VSARVEPGLANESPASQEPGWRVRAIERVDAEALLMMCAEHAQYEGEHFDRQSAAARLLQALFDDAPRLHAWIAQADGVPVGYATVAREFSTWAAREYLHMDCLFVRAHHRGSGVGAALLQAVVDFAERQQLREVQWQTPAWNTDAVRFYQRFGALEKPKIRFSLPLS
jgi:GNAT superfamily N-acetyltransferase